jgi:hypothetical protein
MSWKTILTLTAAIAAFTARRKAIIVNVVLVCIFCNSSLLAADRYWVGGAGNWNDASHWSLASGGVGGATIPGSADIAIFDGLSGGATTTINISVQVQGLNLASGFAGLVDASSQSVIIGLSGYSQHSGNFIAPGAAYLLTISGNFIYAGGSFSSSNGTVKFIGGAKTVAAGGAVFHDVVINTSTSNLQIFEVDGIWSVSGDLTVQSTWRLDLDTVVISGNLAFYEVTDRILGTIMLEGDLINEDNFIGTANIHLIGTTLQTVSLTDNICPGLVIDKQNGSVVHFAKGTDLVFPGNFEISHMAGLVTGGIKNGAPVNNYISSATCTGGAKAFIPGALTFGNMNVSISTGGNQIFDANGIWTIDGDLTITSAWRLDLGTVGILGNLIIENVAEQIIGTINLEGDLINNDDDFSGSGNIHLIGTALQTVSLTHNICPGIIIDKPNGGIVHFANGTDLIFPGFFEISHVSGLVTGGMRNGIPANNYISSATCTGGIKGFNPGALTFGNVHVNTSTSINHIFEVNGTALDPWIVEGNLTIQSAWRINLGQAVISGNLVIDEVVEQILGAIHLHGDLIVNDDDIEGSGSIHLVGTGLQTVSLTNNVCPGLVINKPNGSTVQFSNGTDLVFPAFFELSHIAGVVKGGIKNGFPADNFISSALYTGGIKSFSSGALTYGNVHVNISTNGNQIFQVNGTTTANPWIVEGNLRVQSAWRINLGTSLISGNLVVDEVVEQILGTINLHGDLLLNDDNFVGSSSINLIGSGLQIVLLTNNVCPGLVINKSNNSTVHFLNGTDLFFPAFFELSHIAGLVTGGIRNGQPADNYISSAIYTGGTKSSTPGMLTFGNVLVNISTNTNQVFQVNGTTAINPWRIEGDLTIQSAWSVNALNILVDGDLSLNDIPSSLVGNIQVGGNLVSASSLLSGNGTITLKGASDQHINVANTDLPNGLLAINKTSGKVILDSDLTLNGAGQDLTIQAGTLDMNQHSITLPDVFTLKTGATLIRNYCETITSSGGPSKIVMEAGSIKIGCGEPLATTGFATEISTISATMNGSISPNSIATSVYFEWGTDPYLNTFNTTLPQNFGAANVQLPVSEIVSGLNNNSTYYFRIAAQNSLGLVKGSINNFTTNDDLPVAFSMTGGGSYCSGDNGRSVGLSGSEAGTIYKLMRNGLTTNSMATGTGSAISFGEQTVAGTYTAAALDGAVSVPMDGAVIVAVADLPVCNGINVIPSGTVFTGGVATDIYLGYGSQSVTLNLINSLSPGSLTYFWEGENAIASAMLSCTNCPDPVFTPTIAGTYVFTVTITNSNNCITSCQQSICVKDVRHYNSLGQVTNNIVVTHIPPGNPANAHPVSVNANSVATHLAHGCYLGNDNQSCVATLRRQQKSVIEGFKIYPNPSKGEFVVEVPFSEAAAEVSVLDIQGKLVFWKTVDSRDGVQINVSTGAITPGIYLLKVRQGDQFFKSRISIQ